MATFDGFAELRQPAHLVGKLEHDLKRMLAEPGDSYAAFDFFVTAEHILDWQHPGYAGREHREAAKRDNLLLEITSHIANGAKHFIAGAAHHKSVAGIEKQGYADNYVEPGYVEESIVIHLSEAEAAALGARQVGAAELAHRVLEYWRSQLDGA